MKKVICIFTIIVIPLLLFSQTRLHKITIQGKVTGLNNQPVSMARIEVISGDKVISDYIANSSGNYELTLEKEKEYILVYQKHDFVSKKIEFSTLSVSDDELKYGIFPVTLDVVIFENFPGLDTSPLDEPVAKFSYSDNEGDFVFDEKYSASMSKTVDKVISSMKKLKKQAYDNFISDADKLSDEDWLEEAILGYQNASELFPDEKYPKQQIDKLKSTLFKSGQNEKAFTEHIRRGDKNYTKQNYKISKSYYKKSLIYKPDELYPRSKLNDIENILSANPELYDKIEKDACEGVWVQDKPLTSQNNTNTDNGQTNNSQNYAQNEQGNDNNKSTNNQGINGDYSKKSGINNISNHSVPVNNKSSDSEKNQYLNDLLDKYKTSGDSANVGRVNLALGIEAFNNQSYDNAIDYFRKAYELFGNAGMTSEQAAVAESMADIYFSMYRYSSASDWYARANSLYDESGNKEKADGALLKSADASYQSGDLEQALSKYLVSLNNADKNADLSSIYNSIGVIHFEMDNMDEALRYYNLSVSSAEPKGNIKEISMSYNNIGNIKYEIREYNQALQYYNRSILAKTRIDYKAGIAVSLHNIANVFRNTGDFKKALEYYYKSEQFAIASGNTDVIYENYGALAEIYSKTNDCSNAIKYYKLYSETKHLITRRLDGDQINESSPYYANLFENGNELSILRDEIQRQRLLAKYESSKKQKEIEYLNIQNQLNAQRLINSENRVEIQRYLIAGTCLGLLLLLLFMISLFRQIRQKKKANFLLAEQNEEIKSQKQEIESQRDMLFEQKNEIEHIHHELTDSIRYAKRIQDAVLSTVKSLDENFSDNLVIYKPLELVSGDFYWSIKQGSKMIFCVADCTGHGVPGAFMSMLGISFLNEIVQHEKQSQPDIILNFLRESTIEALGQHESVSRYEFARIRDGMDIAICSVDLNTFELQFAGANSSVYIINPGDENVAEIKGDKMPIGVYERMDMFRLKNFQLQKGSSIYLLSDGYIDQFGGPREKKFKREPFKKLLLEINSLPMAQQKERLEKVHHDWKGKMPQIDDITVMGIRI